MSRRQYGNIEIAKIQGAEIILKIKIGISEHSQMSELGIEGISAKPVLVVRCRLAKSQKLGVMRVNRVALVKNITILQQYTTHDDSIKIFERCIIIS